MENHDRYLYHSSPSRASAATSAVDLPNTAVGISAPPSPALEPSDSTLARRRSWGNRLRESERGSSSSSSSEPTQLELDGLTQVQTSPRQLTTNARPVMAQQNQNDERSRTHPYAIDPTHQYGPRTSALPDGYIAGPSTASLMPHRGHFEHEMEDGHGEDDEAHLTLNMLSPEMRDGSPEGYSSGDLEYDGAMTPSTRRRTLRYSVSPSPLKKTESAMKSVSKNLRRISLRVVNLANTGLEGQLRLGDGDETMRRKKGAEDEDGPPVPDLKQALPIRGRTLGFLGSDSKLRLSLFNFLVHP